MRSQGFPLPLPRWVASEDGGLTQPVHKKLLFLEGPGCKKTPPKQADNWGGTHSGCPVAHSTALPITSSRGYLPPGDKDRARSEAPWKVHPRWFCNKRGWVGALLHLSFSQEHDSQWTAFFGGQRKRNCISMFWLIWGSSLRLWNEWAEFSMANCPGRQALLAKAWCLFTFACVIFIPVQLQLSAESVGEVYIKSTESGQYLAMDSDGLLYGSVSMRLTSFQTRPRFEVSRNLVMLSDTHYKATISLCLLFFFQ